MALFLPFDDSALVHKAGAETIPGEKTFGNGTGNALVHVDGATNGNKQIRFKSAGAERFRLGVGGSDDFFLQAWDAGAPVDVPLNLVRAPGGVLTLARPSSFNALVTAAAGITFGNEALNYYDEGAWTPTLAGSTAPGTTTYTTQSGTYRRLGKLVVASALCVVGASSGAAGSLKMRGLPFTSAASGPTYQPGIVWAFKLGTVTRCVATVVNASTEIAFPKNDFNAASDSYADGTDLQAGTYLAATVLYFTD